MTIQEVKDQCWDLIVCPGGMNGCKILQRSEILMKILRKQNDQGKLIGAIGGAPAIVLNAAGLLTNTITKNSDDDSTISTAKVNVPCTCYPLPEYRNILPHASNEDVVVHKNIITSAGSATALNFALRLGATLFDSEEKAYHLARTLLDKDFIFDYKPKSKNKLTTISIESKNQETDVSDKDKKSSSSTNAKSDNIVTTNPNKTKNDDNVITPKKETIKASIQTTRSTRKQKSKTKSPSKIPVKKTNTSSKKAKPTTNSTNRNSISSEREKKTPTKKAKAFANNEIFFGIVMPKLKKLKFKYETGNRQGDYNLFPPGITKQNGRKRVDYFDSLKAIEEFLSSRKKYAKYAKLYQACIAYYKERKKLKEEPSLRKIYNQVVKEKPSLRI